MSSADRSGSNDGSDEERCYKRLITSIPSLFEQLVTERQALPLTAGD